MVANIKFVKITSNNLNSNCIKRINTLKCQKNLFFKAHVYERVTVSAHFKTKCIKQILNYDKN